MSDVLARLTAGERRAVAQTLNALEADAVVEDEALAATVDTCALHHRPGGLVVGLTGPPGVGKSTLAGRLVSAWREASQTVGVIAVDPSSRTSGGALLGDRARMGLDGRDPGVFVRSMAARDRLGGLAPATEMAVYVMRAAWDRLLVETVGVGQSETDVAEVADVTVVVIQPGSGDTLQFIKSGLMDVPDVLVVNKADMGAVAKRAATDLRAALKALQRRETPVVEVSAMDGVGIERLVATIEGFGPFDTDAREARLCGHAVRMYADEYGRQGLRRRGGRKALAAAMALSSGGPLRRLRQL